MASVIYDDIEPFDTGFIQVSTLHRVYWERSGNPDGKAVVVLHGGPGGGCQPDYRSYFNPAKYHIIMFDQRGCGRSTPHAELCENNTMALVADIERLRELFDIERWQVFGGSWGSTLSLIYAESFPHRVTELVLRGIFMCRPSELHWFYQEGASHIFPDAFAPYREFIPKEEQHKLMRAYYKALTSPDMGHRKAAAKEWTTWEMATSRLMPDVEYLAKGDDDEFAMAFARIECHYFVNEIFMEPNTILANIHKIQDIPGVIVHGRYDVVCPVQSAWELHQAWPKSQLTIIPDAGHSMKETGIAQALINATNSFA